MSKSIWREHCRPIITKVLDESKGKSESEIKKSLRDAYPYGEREYHPYKIWCDEIRVQRKLKKKKVFIDKNQALLL